jgi:DNA-binding MarR family transcriptional regulator
LALAQHLGVDRTVMTYLLDDLESSSLIERRPDPADRRARRIIATPLGNQRLELLTSRRDEVEGRLLAPLEASERTSFRAMVQLLATRIEASNLPLAPCGESPA